MTIFQRLNARNEEMKRHARQDIYRVLTIAEVCNGWNKHYKTVIQAIKASNIVARKSGKAWIISYRSVVAWWGEPSTVRDHTEAFLDLE